MNRILRIGSQPGPDVMDLQDALNVLLATSREWARKPRLAVDGVFGRQTQLRVMELQESRGLLADGIVTLVVWEQIRVSLGKIPGLAIVRPLGGGGAGACVKEEQKAQGESKNLDSLAEMGSKRGDSRFGGSTSAAGGALSCPQVITWRLPLKGIDRASLVYYSTSSSGGDGGEKDDEEKKQELDDDDNKKEA